MGMELTETAGSQATNVCGHRCAWPMLTYFAHKQSQLLRTRTLETLTVGHGLHVVGFSRLSIGFSL